jgi:hypothetical protein
MGLFDAVSSAVSNLSNNAITQTSINQAASLVQAEVSPAVSAAALSKINAGVSAIQQAASGNLLGAAAGLLNSGVISGALASMGGEVLTQLAYMSTANPLMGGITPFEAKQIYAETAGTQFAKQNLFLVEVTDLSSGLPQIFGGSSGPSFNMFVTGVDYSPISTSGEKYQIGAGSMDSVRGREPVEMRITTLDDKKGTVKSWFEYKVSQMINDDGTVGVPADYLVKIRVLHAFITNDSNIADSQGNGGYENSRLVRPVSMDLSLSRRDDGLQEVHLTFTQHATFMTV